MEFDTLLLSRLQFALAISFHILSPTLRSALRCFSPLSRALVAMIPAGFLATLAGWYVAEAGRQPSLVQGILRTAEGVAAVPAEQVLGTFSAFLALYVVLFAASVFYMVRLVRTGPGAHVDESRLAGPGQAAVAMAK